MPFDQSALFGCRVAVGCATLDVELDEGVEAGIPVALDVDRDGSMNLCVSGSGSCGSGNRSGTGRQHS